MGTLDIDTYVVDTLMPDLVGHDRQPAAFLVYLLLWRRCGSAGDGCAASLREISEGTGLSKRSVQSALSNLSRRHLVEVERGGITAIPEYSVLRPWAVK
jgi:DNA-binding transcriptional ArsR family regulator